jgi:hypothetical protein
MKLIHTITLAAIITCFTADAGAAQRHMIFWYPGEAGSTAEAEPVLSAFFDYVNKRLTGDKIDGKYFNTVEDGLKYLGVAKPVIGIISLSAFEQNKTKFQNAEAILATLPLPSGKAAENYTLVGNVKSPGSSKQVYCSEPLGADFLRSRLFPDLPADLKIVQTSEMFFTLKKIASGELNAVAALTPAEAFSLKNIKVDWASSIKPIETSKEVPSARLTLFDRSWAGRQQFTEVLLAMANDAEGKEILAELRLAGFQRP